LSVALAAPSAHAKRNGIDAAACWGCHAASDFDGAATLTPDGPLGLGETTGFTLTINESHMGAAGFWISTGGVGTLQTVSGSGARSAGAALVHSSPLSAPDHVATVHFNWTAPTTPGEVDFYVSVVAVNGSANGTAGDDRSGEMTLSTTFGCEPLTLYEDIDGDGFGDAEFSSQRCAPHDEWVLEAGDCNDLWATIYPGAPELANGKDDNCDGEVDEGAQDDLGYVDADRDGFGGLFATQMAGVRGKPGYAPSADDCDDTDPSINPGVVGDACDGHDNNCNGITDEDTFQYCGVGRCSQLVEGCTATCVPGQPYAETCNGLDDDCNGESDEGELCPPGEACVQFRCQAVAPASSSAGGAVSTPDASGVGSQEPPPALDAGGASSGAGLPAVSTSNPTPADSAHDAAHGSDAATPGSPVPTHASGAAPSGAADSAAHQPTGGCRLVLGDQLGRTNAWGLALCALLIAWRRRKLGM
jgi:hypothetical protein